jgi:hypothetical protein
LRKIAYLIEEKKIDLSEIETRTKYLAYAGQYPERGIKIT